MPSGREIVWTYLEIIHERMTAYNPTDNDLSLITDSERAISHDVQHEEDFSQAPDACKPVPQPTSQPISAIKGGVDEDHKVESAKPSRSNSYSSVKEDCDGKTT